MRSIGSALAAGAVLLLSATAVLAQSGGVTVVVTDQDGVPLPGATVTLGSEVGYVKTSASMTNPKGEASFPVLRPGAGYWVEVSFPTFGTVKQDQIRVSMSQDQTITIALVPEMQERIKVVAERDVIDIETTEQVTKFSDEFIADLPVPGRSYTNVITMAPGVQDADGDGNPNVHGSRDRDFSAMVGGVRNVDPLTGQRLSEVNLNTIEEMEVITAGAGAEFGRAQGGFANIVQKQGSNEHEGVFEFYLRTSKLDGTGAANQDHTSEPDFETYWPSIQLSGPILRDKLWYSLSHEYRHTDDPRNIGSQIVVVPTRRWSSFDKVTWQVSPRNKLAFTFQSDPVTTENQGTARGRPPSTTFALDTGTQTYTMAWTAPYSPKILVESTLAYQERDTTVSPTEVGVDNACTDDSFLSGAQCTEITSGERSGSFPRVINDQSQRLSAQGMATVFAGDFLGGSHTFTLGFGVENERYFRKQLAGTTIDFIILNTLPEDGSEEEDPNPLILAFTEVFIPPLDESRVTATNWSINVGDEFKPRQNVVVNLSARVDREEMNAEGHEIVQAQEELAAFNQAWAAYETNAPNSQPAGLWTNYFTGYEGLDAFRTQMQEIVCLVEQVFNEGTEGPGNCLTNTQELILDQDLENTKFYRRAEDREIYNTNVSPRLAVSWSPWTNGKTAFKASVGRYYNLTPLTIALQELNPEQVNITFDNSACEPGVPCNLDPSSGITPAISVFPLDPDYSTAYKDEIAFTIDRELWAETSIHLDYINNRFRDQAQDRNINLATGDYGACQYQTGPAGAKPQQRHPWIGLSPGSGQQLVDPLSGEVYLDTDPGLGDGRLDDCVGRVETFSSSKGGGGNPNPGDDGTSFFDLHRPDGRLDLYRQNPLWGDIYVIGNYNEFDYEAWQLRLVRRQYRSWEMQASYTWSEAIGDGEDYNQFLGDDPSLDDSVRGYQSYDQRHQVKLSGTTITPWGIRLGTFVTWMSGLPYSIVNAQRALDTQPIATIEDGPLPDPVSRVRLWYPSGVRNSARNAARWNVDLNASKEIRLSRGLNMQVKAEVYNLLNDGTYQVWNPENEQGFQVNGNDVDGVYYFGRRWQLGMKLAW